MTVENKVLERIKKMIALGKTVSLNQQVTSSAKDFKQLK